jgi:hypothetical protein
LENRSRGSYPYNAFILSARYLLSSCEVDQILFISSAIYFDNAALLSSTLSRRIYLDNSPALYSLQENHEKSYVLGTIDLLGIIFPSSTFSRASRLYYFKIDLLGQLLSSIQHSQEVIHLQLCRNISHFSYSQDSCTDDI